MKCLTVLSPTMQSLCPFRNLISCHTYQHFRSNTCLVSTLWGNGSVCSQFAEGDLHTSTCFPYLPLAFETRNKHFPKTPHGFLPRMISKSNLIPNDNAVYSPISPRKRFHNKLQMQRKLTSKFMHTSSFVKTYEETVSALNGLQSNAATILRSQKDPELCMRNMAHMRWLLDVLDIKQEDLKSLNVIHVAGTKGKGSTCAFTESILRSSGYKTGFFSSPHLVVVRERIRINGKPLSQSHFVSYFWQVYDKLSSIVNQEDKSMPTYFMFLTLMAFHVFLQEKVDVAVIEVGIGGEYDFTNIINFPAIVGITSIGLDHVSLLGDTLEKIAWQKAGILKEGALAFTVPQSSGVLSVFLERAAERKCPLYLAPSLNGYRRLQSQQDLNISAEIQEVNISLALQLCHAWMKRKLADFKDSCVNSVNSLLMAETFDINSAFEHGLQHCIWLGRFQKLRKDKVVYFLDGAHTSESIEYCAKWFLHASSVDDLQQDKRPSIFRVLIFNCTRDRKPEVLLSPLAEIYFDLAIFCTNNIQSSLDSSSDLSNYNADRDMQIQQCLNNMNMWQHLQSSAQEEQFGTLSSRNSVFVPCSQTLMQPFVSDVLKCLEDPKNSTLSDAVREDILKANEIHVLVTGSLHLVGSVLSILDPEMQCS